MKTIDQKAKEAYVDDTLDCNQLFKAGVEFAQQWIPVTEELPEETPELMFNEIRSVPVLVKRRYPNGEIEIEVDERYNYTPNGNLKFSWDNDNDSCEVIEWRPIERI